MFRLVSVLLPEADRQGGAMTHGAEWASRLGAPLRKLERTSHRPLADVRRLLSPYELCVFDHDLPARFKESLLCGPSVGGALICPKSWRPMSRVLVLNSHPRPADGFLDATAALCRAFGVTPVLLTVAGTETEARSRERFVEEAFARRGLAVDCDLAAGDEPTAAVVHAARWRRCSHCVVEHRPLSPWRRWLGGDVIRELAALPDFPAIVALHDAAPAGDACEPCEFPVQAKG